MNVNIGHQHPKVVQAIQEQASRLCFVQPALATEPRGILGRMLAERIPGSLKKTFFCLGGIAYSAGFQTHARPQFK